MSIEGQSSSQTKLLADNKYCLWTKKKKKNQQLTSEGIEEQTKAGGI